MPYISLRATKRANQMVISPFIIQARPGAFMDAYNEVAQFDAFSNISEGVFGFGMLNLATNNVPFLTQKQTMKSFNMFTAMIPREAMPMLVKSDTINAVWPDDQMYAFSYPTLTDGVFEMRTKTDANFKFTSTVHTRALMGGDKARDLGFKGQNMTVAVVDTGGTKWHQATPHLQFNTVLIGQVVDHQGHGEWCAACIGGYESKDSGLSNASSKDVMTGGFVPDAELVSIKALGYGIGTGSTSSIIKGVELAVASGAKVISMSLGGPCSMDSQVDDPFTPVMKDIVAKGIIPVIAAGNEGPGSTTVGSPGWIEECLTIGAYDPISGVMADFSSRGPTQDGRTKPDCIAPGVNIDAPIIGMLDYAGDQKRNRYSPISGTSMATPCVAGLVMQMAQCHKERLKQELTVDEIKEMLRHHGSSKSNDAGWGIINWALYEEHLKVHYGVTL